MTVEVTLDTLCTILEEAAGELRIEELAAQLIEGLALLGDDLLDHLDPPLGLKTWLSAHGLSLVETRNVPAPAVWEALQQDEEEADLEEKTGGSLHLQVGASIEYRTAPSGPRNQSYMGSGRIVQLLRAGDEDCVLVEIGPNQEIMINLATDFIRPLN